MTSTQNLIRTTLVGAGLAAAAFGGLVGAPATAAAAPAAGAQATSVAEAGYHGRWVAVGSPNLRDACRRQYPAGDRVLTLFSPNRAYDWKCAKVVSVEGERVVLKGSISAERQCRVQYGAGVRSHTYRPADAYSWRCERWVL